MATHDVICTEIGWAHSVDGVRAASFATWTMAINAARIAAERDIRSGRPASLRYQGPDGEMRSMPTRATRTAAQIGVPVGQERPKSQATAS
jgi:hypothetical protein